MNGAELRCRIFVKRLKSPVLLLFVAACSSLWLARVLTKEGVPITAILFARLRLMSIVPLDRDLRPA